MEMSDKLKSFIHWMTTILIFVCIIGFIFIPIAIIMLAPTFWPESDFSGFKDWISSASIFVSFFSAILGAYSIHQASDSNKTTQGILNDLQTIKANQEITNRIILMPSPKIRETEYETKSWDNDNTTN